MKVGFRIVCIIRSDGSFGKFHNAYNFITGNQSIIGPEYTREKLEENLNEALGCGGLFKALYLPDMIEIYVGNLNLNIIPFSIEDKVRELGARNLTEQERVYDFK